MTKTFSKSIWVVGFALLGLLSIRWPFSLIAISAGEEETRVYHFDSKPGQTLSIQLKNGGSISIAGWEKESVEIMATINKSEIRDWHIDAQKMPWGISIITAFKGSRQWGCGVSNLQVRVPHQYNLKLKTIGGEISIDDIIGHISGKTMGGSMTLNKLKKFIDLKTNSGNILLKNSAIDGRIKTMSGRVLLENVTGNVKGVSLGGNVIYKNVEKQLTHSNKNIVRISIMGGDIDVNDAPYGAEVATMGGNIHIRSVADFVNAATMGGDIQVDAIDGKISAKTITGNIQVIMTGEPSQKTRSVRLASMNGNISLIVPAGLSMDVDLEIAQDIDAPANYRFITDFKLEQSQSNIPVNSTGKRKKYQFGKATINGGKHKIRISTVNGNITLKQKQ